MKRFATTLMALMMIVPAIVAQDSAPAGAPSSTNSDNSQETIRSEETIKKLAALRAKQKAELEEQLREAENKVAEVEAKRKELEEQSPRLQEDISRAENKKDEAYKLLAQYSEECDNAVGAARLKYQQEEIDRLQQRFDEAFRQQKEKHDRDTSFIEANRWKPADLQHLDLAMDPEDSSKRMLFEGGKGNSAEGWFSTFDFETGAKTWHAIPAGSKFAPMVQRRNPFLVDLCIRPGIDLTGTGSTNMFDWDLHVYVEKDFRRKDPHTLKQEANVQAAEAGASGVAFNVIGVSWPVDLGRPVCRMFNEPYVFEPVPMPVQTNVDANTDPIPALVGSWVPRGELEALIAKKEDQRQATKVASKYLDTLSRSVSTVQERVDRRLKENDDQLKTAVAEVNDLKSRIEEYAPDFEEQWQESEGANTLPEGSGGDGSGGGDLGGLGQ